jgi:hypothetical protein
VIFLLSAFTAGKPGHVVRVYALNVCTAGWSMIMLDAIRMPRFIGLCTVRTIYTCEHVRYVYV